MKTLWISLLFFGAAVSIAAAENFPAIAQPKEPKVSTPTFQQPLETKSPGVTNLIPSFSGGNNSANSRGESISCRGAGVEFLAPPRVNVYSLVQTNAVVTPQYRAQGSVEGVCLVEAGYFESGRKQQLFRIRTDRNFQRFEFDVVIKPDKNPEIRVYNVNGASDVYRIDPGEFDDQWKSDYPRRRVLR